MSVRQTVATYPERGYSELKAQSVSSAESVVNTIIEGCGASTQREFARFLEMAIKSNKELEGELELAESYKILHTRRCQLLCAEVIDTRRMLIGLRKTVLETPDRPPESRDSDVDRGAHLPTRPEVPPSDLPEADTP